MWQREKQLWAKFRKILLIAISYTKFRMIPVLGYWVLVNTCQYWQVLVLAQYFSQ